MHRDGDGEPWEHLLAGFQGPLSREEKLRDAKRKLIVQTRRVMWTCTCGADYAMSVRVCPKCHKKQPKRNTRTLHFRWKFTGKGEKGRFVLYFCHGGKTIAAWPTSAAETDIHALVYTRMMGKKGYLYLSRDRRKVHSMALRLRAALLKAEEGPRRISARQQRERLDQLLKLGIYKPVVDTRKAMWTCNCGTDYAMSVRVCSYCHKRAPRLRP